MQFHDVPISNNRQRIHQCLPRKMIRFVVRCGWQGLKYCVPGQQHLASSTRGPSTSRYCGTFSGASQRCNSLAMLHGAVESGSNLIPEPVDAQLATEADMADLFPFTWNISQFRGRSLSERGIIVHYVPQVEPHPAQRKPAESYFSITYPFTTNRVLRQQYQRFSSPFLRIGLVLEDLDSFAADVATRHLGGLPPGYTVVTAAIDKIALTTAAPSSTAAAASAPHTQHDRGSGRDSSEDKTLQQDAKQTRTQSEAEVETPALELRRELSHRVTLDITQYPMSVHSDLRLVGQVCWAGRSSMEVLVEISTAAAAGDTLPVVTTAHPTAARSSAAGGVGSADSNWTSRAVAHFVMVLAKSQATPNHHQQQQQQPQQLEGPAWGVPCVEPQSPLEQRHFDTAAARAAAHRAKRHQTSLLTGIEPGAEEVHLLYQVAEAQLQRQIQRQQEDVVATAATAAWQQQDAGSSVSSHAGARTTPVQMSATSQGHLAVMHSQDRNNANNIFGGHLLKLASELAYSTAVLHAGRHCEAVALGDVNFKRPVPIGCVLSFRAKVVYTSGHLLRVSVVATKHQQLLERPSELHASVTNDFSFVFCAVGCHPLRHVEPESLREAVQYLAAHRQHLADGYYAPPALLQPGMEHVLTSPEVV